MTGQIIPHNLDDLFRGMQIKSGGAFRVIPNADGRGKK